MTRFKIMQLLLLILKDVHSCWMLNSCCSGKLTVALKSIYIFVSIVNKTTITMKRNAVTSSNGVAKCEVSKQACKASSNQYKNLETKFKSKQNCKWPPG